jgi:surfeit locus 1 family protein
MRSTNGDSQSTQRKTPFVLFLLLGFVFLVLLALGSWQVKRLIWKQDLIARVDARAHAAPVAPPTDWANITADNSEYLRVSVSGTYQYQHQEYTTALTALDGGYWVMTPLVTADGNTVYINRGFIPTASRKAFEQDTPPDTGIVTVSGLLRMPEHSAFLRTNEPELRRWYSRDVASMGQQAGLSNIAPYFIDADRTADATALPIGGMTQISFPNNHLVYALTWYGLAALLVGMLIYVRRKEKEGSSD